ncbi:MAG: dihydrodipicolinate synthase family protein, partial [Pseudomonadota bacterium]|nr:dihydrodipicolinate synthase family protein [Pseudomonadota bacterium]
REAADMTKPTSFSGIISATPTPLTREGAIDRKAVETLVEGLVAAPTAAIAPNGGTGEATALTRRQKALMLETTLAAVNGRVPVIAGILSPGIGDVLEESQAAANAGADALLVVTPYYARATQDGIVDYYKHLSDSVDLPIMLYEIPYRTGISLTPDTVARLADETRVNSMKACSTDMRYQMLTVEAAGDKISILTGQEDVFPMHMAMGARGGFFASSCICPFAWHRIYQLSEAGQTDAALALHRRIMPYVDLFYKEHNPAGLKAALEIVGNPHGGCLPPLQSASDTLVQELRNALPEFLKIEADAKDLVTKT